MLRKASIETIMMDSGAVIVVVDLGSAPRLEANPTMKVTSEDIPVEMMSKVSLREERRTKWRRNCRKLLSRIWKRLGRQGMRLKKFACC